MTFPEPVGAAYARPIIEGNNYFSADLSEFEGRDAAKKVGWYGRLQRENNCERDFGVWYAAAALSPGLKTLLTCE